MELQFARLFIVHVYASYKILLSHKYIYFIYTQYMFESTHQIYSSKMCTFKRQNLYSRRIGIPFSIMIPENVGFESG